MSRICLLCARGGSKGVPNKNIRDLNGKPLLAYSLEQALKSNYFDEVVISSDSNRIVEIAEEFGATKSVNRPAELASDTSGKVTAIRHCLLTVEKNLGLEFDIIVDLDITSPLRLNSDITGAVDLLESSSSQNVISGTPSRRNPYFNLVEKGEDGIIKLCKGGVEKQVLRRQDAPRCFDMNASVYVWRRQRLLATDSLFHPDTLLFEMPEERSIDIDSDLDFKIVEFLMSLKEGIK